MTPNRPAVVLRDPASETTPSRGVGRNPVPALRPHGRRAASRSSRPGSGRGRGFGFRGRAVRALWVELHQPAAHRALHLAVSIPRLPAAPPRPARCGSHAASVRCGAACWGAPCSERAGAALARSRSATRLRLRGGNLPQDDGRPGLGSDGFGRRGRRGAARPRTARANRGSSGRSRTRSCVRARST